MNVLPREAKYENCNCCGKREAEGVVRFRGMQIDAGGEYITNSYECSECSALTDSDYGRVRGKALEGGGVWMQGDIFD